MEPIIGVGILISVSFGSLGWAFAYQLHQENEKNNYELFEAKRSLGRVEKNAINPYRLVETVPDIKGYLGSWVNKYKERFIEVARIRRFKINFQTVLRSLY